MGGRRKVVAWNHGATVAFREEVGAVLERLLVRGSPSFDSVLILLAATRHYWPVDSATWRNQLQVTDLAAKQIQRQPPHLVAGKLSVFQVVSTTNRFMRLDGAHWSAPPSR
jgi:hypothetical protein